jgi:CDP-glycerol glycerophosphotransferase (TagB/SpsB family)
MTSPNTDRPGWLARIRRAAGALVGNALLYPIAKLMPRRKDLWLFGYQRGGFAGNSKALFLWGCEHRPDIRSVWISPNAEVVRLLRAHGYSAYRKGSIKGIWLCLRAGAYFFCHGPEDISLPLSGGAFLVNLWHGVGLKATAYGDPNSQHYRYSRPTTGWLDRIRHRGVRISPDVLVSTSEFTQAHFSSQFGLPSERCPPLGYPRLDSVQDPALAERLSRFAGSEPRALWPQGVEEVYAYVPTYRDSKRSFLGDAFPDIERLNAVLERRNAVLFLRLHRHTHEHAGIGTERIRLWPKGVDLDVSLPHLTGLITDYSSVHYDYIYHSDRGSILYPFDEAEYCEQDRLLLYPFAENTAGYRAGNFDELVSLLDSGEALRPHPDAARVRRKFWGDATGPASLRVSRHVEQLLAARTLPAPCAVSHSEA